MTIEELLCDENVWIKGGADLSIVVSFSRYENGRYYVLECKGNYHVKNGEWQYRFTEIPKALQKELAEEEENVWKIITKKTASIRADYEKVWGWLQQDMSIPDTCLIRKMATKPVGEKVLHVEHLVFGEEFVKVVLHFDRNWKVKTATFTFDFSKEEKKDYFPVTLRGNFLQKHVGALSSFYTYLRTKSRYRLRFLFEG